ncbi:hypothetical protein ACFVOR_37320 [Streptomyces sp. NPDC057837]|uniref:hypothetical protein n=1 Tax=Streptomyces sp. NPDC057837 TaxID=3346260 RepID=UPI0036A70D7D
MTTDSPTEKERLALCEWLTANGINPNTVPLREAGLRIDEKDGQRVIAYTQFVRNELTGNILSDPDNPGPVTSSATAPCRVEPPAWLGVPGAQP